MMSIGGGWRITKSNETVNERPNEISLVVPGGELLGRKEK